MVQTHPDSGKYIVIKSLADGGMASLYLARDASQPKRLFVVKKIVNNYNSHPSFIKMFRREAEISAMLNHPNLIKTHEIGVTDNDLFIVLEFIDGANLKQILSSPKAFKMATILYILKEISRGLAYLHQDVNATNKEHTFIHRDISPQNIMIDKRGEVKIIDFGISKSYQGNTVTEEGSSLKGKFSYMSPEQAQGEELSTASDIFSLGLLAIELFQGHRCFRNLNELQILKTLSHWNTSESINVTKGIPDALAEVAQTMLMADPKQRPKAIQLLYLFETILQNVDPTYDKTAFCRDLSEDIAKLSVATDLLPEGDDALPVINLYTFLTEDRTRYQKKSKNYAPLFLSIGALLVGASIYLKKVNLQVRQPSSVSAAALEHARNPMTRLQFPQALVARWVLEVNGRRLTENEKTQGIDVPVGRILYLRAYNPDDRKWISREILMNANGVISLDL
jgi:serine/threonine protein kinase